ncbi:MAG: hypothetical protein JWN94_2784 [Betaproteobacteria bacterium]|nr:hypothetical protein [Betaproteobacteria bacterium]
MTQSVRATDTGIAVFARAPEPGAAKTRLIPMLGAGGAATLQKLLIARTLATAIAADVGTVKLWCSPSAQHPAMSALMRRHGIVGDTQCEGELGDRMLDAAVRTLETSARVLLIGTDCPALTAADLQSATAALDNYDAVLIPAEDGGYVLLGLARPDPRLFSQVPWGSDQVMAITRVRLAELNWRWRELAPLWDVDRPADVERLQLSGLMPEFGACGVDIQS